MSSLISRLSYNSDDEFLKLINMYLKDDSEDLRRKSLDYFSAMTNKPAMLQNHPPVLGISIGGSYSKVTMAGFLQGKPIVTYAYTVKNPDKPLHFYDFLDQLLLNDPVAKRYLYQPGHRAVGLSIPVMVNDNDIPFHPNKINALEGVIARCESEIQPELNLNSNMQRYFKSRGITEPSIFFEADPIAAHLGAYSLVNLNSNQQSLLLVCGTGMAIADYEFSRTLSRLPMLDFDEGLFPIGQTEKYGFEYSFAGVGLYSLFSRCIAIKSQESSSHLNPALLCPLFKNRYDSKTVSELWEISQGVKIESKAISTLRLCTNKKGFDELVEISCKINERAIESLANALIAVAIKINIKSRTKKQFAPLFEGGIALNKTRLPLIKKHLIKTLHRDDLFKKLGIDKPSFCLDKKITNDITYSKSISEAIKQNFDVSTLGSVVGAIIKSNIKKGKEVN